MSSVPAADTKIDNNLGEFSISRLDIHIVHTKIFLPISAEHSAGNAIFFSVRLLLKSLINGKLNESLVAMHGQVAGTFFYLLTRASRGWRAMPLLGEFGCSKTAPPPS